jgi:transposase
VADPYHVIRLARQAFDEFLKPFMKDILNAYISAIDENLIVRPTRRLVKKGWLDTGGHPQETLSETDGIKEDEKKVRRRTAAEIRSLLHTKIGEMNETAKKAVRYLLERRPDVAVAYYYLQSVMHLYHVQISAAEASIKLDKFQSKLPQHVRDGLSTFLTRCREDRDAICAFWSSGWTNSEMEAQSKVINQIYAAAYGCGFKELRRRWLYGESDSVILGRDKEKVLITKKGPEKKGIREIKKMPRPEAVPIEGPGGQLSLFFEWPSQDDQASVKSEDEPVCKPPDSDSD